MNKFDPEEEERFLREMRTEGIVKNMLKKRLDFNEEVCYMEDESCSEEPCIILYL